ncbi:MAG TPA: hypothetical protein VIK38_02185 [Coriobacteriia bacterium]
MRPNSTYGQCARARHDAFMASARATPVIEASREWTATAAVG